MEITNNYKDYDDDTRQVQAEETVTLLMLVIDGGDYALHFDNVVQIAQVGDIFPVPEFPDYVLGFTKIGDNSVPVIDLRKRFGFDQREKDERSCIVVVKDENGIWQGLLVDTARQLRQTQVAQIMPAPQLGEEAYTKYVTGMFKRKNGNLCYIIDPKRMYTLTAGGMRHAKKLRLKRKSSAQEPEDTEE